MKITEILGDSVREDLSFIASKMTDLDEDSSILFIGEKFSDIKKINSHERLSKTQIAKDDEKKIQIFYPDRSDLKIFFMTNRDFKKLDENFDYLIFLDSEKIDFVDFNKAHKKIFILSARRQESQFLKKLREEKLYVGFFGRKSKDYEIIQLGLPEMWDEF